MDNFGIYAICRLLCWCNYEQILIASVIVTNTLRQHPGGFSLAFLFTTEYFVTPGVNGGWAEWVATVAMGRAL